MAEKTAPKLTVLAGPTAVGKGTVSAYIRKNYPQVWFSVSATTRDPRPGEVDGEHYYFTSEEAFDAMVDNRQMLEWAVVHNSYKYGTMRTMVEDALEAGKHVFLEIDIQGARQIRNNMPDAQFIFLAPPSWEELVNRLVGRNTETKEEQAARLETAKDELAAEVEFDETVINDEVERAAEEIIALMGLNKK
ncbi:MULTISPECIES: guanylate kinase [unclassified Rothia (in: high G+C Gram-positive bacteria)]|uniref:guanylate kinase n=1 Tax=unclassified Rothia (in: high G+C Gram-positive bacteria) TaxID=2689056 RepID=UPI001955FD1A|nr:MULTISPECIES: guanylate kinase [unclassified Rothia (in: high G+C Gram-positive bacteria)]MBM7050506.1 guanylate kinase [Rothia sp. ZJ1223]QRZ60702.1 guanylate kinase [Rothia sp. ZJ932]